MGRKVQSCWALSARNPSDIFIANAASGDGDEKCLDASNITMGLEVVAGERRKEVAAEGIEVGCWRNFPRVVGRIGNWGFPVAATPMELSQKSWEDPFWSQ